MIYVTPKPEPNDFNIKIRQKGNTWLINNPNYKINKLPNYWVDCLDDLHAAYGGVCAYYGWYIDKVSGACSVDHFHPKSDPNYQNVIYEWSNYRFACLNANRKKKDFQDVIDPFSPHVAGAFELNLSSGEISHAPNLSNALKQVIQATINRLKLNEPNNCQKRREDFAAYENRHINSDFLKKINPFVWHEAHRKGLL